jgi:hypothetical protein
LRPTGIAVIAVVGDRMHCRLGASVRKATGLAVKRALAPTIRFPAAICRLAEMGLKAKGK